MDRSPWTAVALAAAVVAGLYLLSDRMALGGAAPLPAVPKGAAVATFAGGCFWCVESAFDGHPGVLHATSGYTGGKITDPSYKQVAGGTTKHIESVRVVFDPKKISYEQLVEHFWRQIDPTDAGGQFADRGHQYTTAIFTHTPQQRAIAERSKQKLSASSKFDKPIATVIRDAGPFYAAEEYHQDYHLKNTAHYKRYYYGSGRAGFLEKTWGNKKKPTPGG